VAVVGIDGGGLDDLLGAAVIGRCREDARWLIWNKAWAQDDVLTLRPENTVKLRDFKPPASWSCAPTRPRICARSPTWSRTCCWRGLLPEAGAIGLDPQGVSALVDEMVSRGVTDEQLVAIPQGYKLSGAVWGLERKLKDGTAGTPARR
jgi:phage terminase large subunit-like protein